MKKQKIFIPFHGRFPSEKAAALFLAHSAEAFAKEGCEVVVVAPRRFGASKESVSDYYGIDQDFRVVYLPTIDLFSIPVLSRIAFSVSYLVFSISFLVYALVSISKSDWLYSNESLPLILTSFFFSKSAYEMHDFPEKKLFLYRFLLRRVCSIIVTNSWKKERLIKQFGVPEQRLLCEMNAVDVSSFDIGLTQDEARKRLSLSSHMPIVVYTGHLYAWKGVDVVAQAARLMPSTLFVFVGGTAEDGSRFKEKCSSLANVMIVGQRPHSEIPLWQRSADVLVLPNTAKENISLYYTSPMKLFEYMASGVPIVASRLPSVLEVVGESGAAFFDPDDPESLAKTISSVIGDTSFRQTLSANALATVRSHTWELRAKRIVSFLRGRM